MKTTEYYLITLEISVGELDVVEGLLYLEGMEGIEETATTASRITLQAFFKKGPQPLENFLEHLRQILPSETTLKGSVFKRDATSFKSVVFDPLELIPNVWILPPPDMSPIPSQLKGEMIIIRPGMAFGTGRHESTQLCAQGIQSLENPETKTLLDVGTGSGILAIFATKRGFKKVDAVEIDPDARINTRENFELNNIKSVVENAGPARSKRCVSPKRGPSHPLLLSPAFSTTSMKSIQLFEDINAVKNKYDVITANIDPPTLSLLHDALINHLNPNGELILSGITEAQIIESRFGHLKQTRKIQINEWICYHFKLLSRGSV
ncbi:MAG: 50S ribosomal protein L11 methyltransferase [Deltaproteobacteria bacterium]|nr:50S ribosomal protein L11 methyltransferase [Deltaproteobacteria bacterium]